MAPRTSSLTSNLLRWAKGRAKRLGVPFGITAEDIPIPDRCPALGIPLYPNFGGKAQHPYSPSIDRIDPTKGYIPGNVKVISAKANAIKQDASIADLVKVLAYMRRSLKA